MIARQDPEAMAVEARSDETDLWRRLREPGSASVRETLFHRHEPLARRIARRHFLDRRSGDIELEDLNQFAFAGLLEAMDRFDPERGIGFPAFAARRISGSVIDGLAKVSEAREQASFKSRMRRERLRSLAGDDLDTLSLEAAMAAFAELATELAIGFMLEDGGLAHAPDAPAVQASAYDSLAWRELLKRVSSEVASLPEREQTIIRSHYLGDLNFEHLGALLGVSKGRISQLHRAALQTLRARLSKPPARPPPRSTSS